MVVDVVGVVSVIVVGVAATAGAVDTFAVAFAVAFAADSLIGWLGS